jgi:CRP-like cAMP-binding protein
MDSVQFVGPLDRVLLLRTQPMLEALGPVQLAAIAQHAKERHYSRAETIMATDAASQSVHLIVEGEVELVPGDHGPAQRIGAGEAVGFVQMLSRTDRRFEVTAVQETSTLELDWDAQLDVCEEHFAVVMNYVRYLGRLLVDAQRTRGPRTAPAILPDAALALPGNPNLIERIRVLSLSQALSRRCLDALSELAHHIDVLDWSAGASIWRAGDDADDFLLLSSGTLRCRKADGLEFTRHAGELVGMHEALAGLERWHDAVSGEAGLALRIDVEPFFDILEDHFDLALDVLASLAQELLAIRRQSVIE